MTATATLVYSTSTDRDAVVAPELVAQWQRDEDDRAYANQYCFVCSRCTDHVGEHDDLTVAGVAAYDGYDVVWTELGRELRYLDDEVDGALAFALRR